MLYSQNLQKQTRNSFQNGRGGAPGGPVLDPPLTISIPLRSQPSSNEQPTVCVSMRAESERMHDDVLVYFTGSLHVLCP